MVNAELKTMSVKTVKNAWGLVHAAVSDKGFPVPDVKFPQVPIKDIPFLQPEEIIPFCDAIRGDMAEIVVLLEL